MNKAVETAIKWLVIISYLVMVTVNALANILPINGVNTGQVSDSYKNLFAPSGFTFAIWGLIYLMLGAYVLYHVGLFNKNTNKELLNRMGIIFAISSFANAAWIFAWHYKQIGLSVILMLVILICLILIAIEINKEKLSARDALFVKMPFMVYFGWITVAIIANITALLVSIGWNGFGIPEQVWTVIVIIIGFIIGSLTMLKFKSIAYGLVIVWAYIGILAKHVSQNGFAGKYPAVIATSATCIVLLLILIGYMVVRGKNIVVFKR